jgi:hypothetical protein
MECFFAFVVKQKAGQVVDRLFGKTKNKTK